MAIIFCSCSGADKADGFNFAFLSDTQSDPESGDQSVAAALFAEVIAAQPQLELLLLGGDNVNDGADASEWAAFFAATLDNAPDLEAVTALGNHDGDPLTFQKLPPPDDAKIHQQAPGFYSFERGAIHFLILDGNRMGGAYSEDIAWVEQDLAGNDQPWLVAVCHQPPYPPRDIPKDTQRAETMQEHFIPLLERYGADLLLCGHQHTYMRSYPLLAGEISDSGIVYICVNSGGKSYPVGDAGYIAAAAEQPTALLITADGEALSLRAIDIEGETVDEYIITRSDK